TELETVLRKEGQARSLFRRMCRVDAELQKQSGPLASASGEAEDRVISRRWLQHHWWGVAAALVLLALVVGQLMQRPTSIATLVSSEHAAWESSLPTLPGSDLQPGRLRLVAGLATIRFRSGAEMVLEAPATLAIKTPMLARLESGAAVMEVPESAVGFVLETPQGTAIDYGTSFAVHVREEGGPATFEVIQGEISVVVPETGSEVRLMDQQGAWVSEGRLTKYEGTELEEEVEDRKNVVRLRTGGRSWSVIRANREKWMHEEFLSIRRRNEPSNHERRSFFAFDVAGVDWEQVESAQIRLNQVPSGIGYASRLPKMSTIAVYGLTNPEKAEWEVGTTWEEGPFAEDGAFLGTIEIPRSEQRASRVFTSEAMLDFLKQHEGGSVTFILDRNLDPDGNAGTALLLAFASDEHPEAAGPMLELTLKP
ncbi:MAG: FecR domain-containing protein, partial [Verrucomicrobiota bacterium]